MFASLQAQVSDFVSNVNLPSLPALPEALSNLTTGNNNNSNNNNNSSSPFSSANQIENRSLIQHSHEFSSEDEDDDDYNNHHITLDINNNHNDHNSNDNNDAQQAAIGDTVKFYAGQLGSTASHVGGSIATNVSSWRQSWFSSSPAPPQPQPVASSQASSSSSSQVSNNDNSSSSTTQQSSQEYLSSWKESASKRLDDVWTRIKPVATQQAQEQQAQQEAKGWIDQWTSELDQYTTMSKTSRLYGFGITFGIGVVFVALAMGFLPSILVAARIFALFYTFGNCFLIASTFFLVGPMRQLGMMFERDRLIPSSLFLSSLFLTLFAAMVLKSAFLVLILLVVQVVSLAYYILSYIPFGQQIVNVFFSSISTAVRAMF